MNFICELFSNVKDNWFLVIQLIGWISFWQALSWVISRFGMSNATTNEIESIIDLIGLIGLVFLVIRSIIVICEITRELEENWFYGIIALGLVIVIGLVISFSWKNYLINPKLIVFSAVDKTKNPEYSELEEKLEPNIYSALEKYRNLDLVTPSDRRSIEANEPPLDLKDATDAKYSLRVEIDKGRDTKETKIFAFLKEIPLGQSEWVETFPIDAKKPEEEIALWIIEKLDVSVPTAVPFDRFASVDLDKLREEVSANPNSLSKRLELVDQLVNFPGEYKGDESQELISEAASIAKSSFGIEQSDEMATLMMGIVAQRSERYEEAEQYFSRAGKKGEDALDHMKIELGYLVEVMGKVDHAIPDTDNGMPWENGLPFNAMKKASKVLKTRPGYNLPNLSEVEHMLLSMYSRNYITSVPMPHSIVRVLTELEGVINSSPNEKPKAIEDFWKAVERKSFTKQDILVHEMMLIAVHLEEYEFMADRFWGDNYKGWLWFRTLKPFRSSQAFKQKVRESGMLQYWKSHGFPDLCRPLEGDDFDCTLNSKY